MVEFLTGAVVVYVIIILFYKWLVWSVDVHRWAESRPANKKTVKYFVTPPAPVVDSAKYVYFWSKYYTAEATRG
jgi:hypothetical protein